MERSKHGHRSNAFRYSRRAEIEAREEFLRDKGRRYLIEKEKMENLLLHIEVPEKRKAQKEKIEEITGYISNIEVQLRELHELKQAQKNKS